MSWSGYWVALRRPQLRAMTELEGEAAFLAFVGQLLHGDLPVFGRRLRGLECYHESYEGVGQALIRGALSFVLRAGGWAESRAVAGEVLVRQRMMEHQSFGESSGELGASAMALARRLFFHSAGISKEIEVEVTRPSPLDELASLVLLWPYFALDRMPPHIVDDLLWGRFAYSTHELEHSELLQMGAQWSWALPWLAPWLGWCWSMVEERIVAQEIDGALASMEKLRGLLSQVITAGEEHSALWLVPMAFGQRVSGLDVFARLDSFEWMAEGSRQQVEALRESWGQLLEQLMGLVECHRGVRRRHPIDREPAEKLFLALWEEESMGETLSRIGQMRDQALRVLS